MELSKELKLIRQKSCLTQTEFAEAINVSFTTVNRWENGKSRPNLSAMKNLKTFCAGNGFDFNSIQKSWISTPDGIDNNQ